MVNNISRKFAVVTMVISLNVAPIETMNTNPVKVTTTQNLLINSIDKDESLSNQYRTIRNNHSILEIGWGHPLSNAIRRLLAKFGIKEGEKNIIDDETEDLLQENEIFFVLFGLVFLGLVVKTIAEGIQNKERN